MSKTIFIRDYVTLPCDDAAEGIRQAIAAAMACDADEIRFEAGTYPLRSIVTVETDRATHDAGSPGQSSKDVHILLSGLHGLTLVGSTDAEGEPATVLAGVNDGAFHSMLPSVLWCERLAIGY